MCSTYNSNGSTCGNKDNSCAVGCDRDKKWQESQPVASSGRDTQVSITGRTCQKGCYNNKDKYADVPVYGDKTKCAPDAAKTWPPQTTTDVYKYAKPDKANCNKCGNDNNKYTSDNKYNSDDKYANFNKYANEKYADATDKYYSKEKKCDKKCNVKDGSYYKNEAKL